MVIRVSGTKPNALDPWNTNIELEIYGRKSAKGIEYYSRKLDYTTVQCSWEDAHSCVLTFEQQDDTKRLFFIEGSESGYTFKDISDVQ
ncbi:MAG TPA: hypothetical protein VL947_02280 [Cytophagales bacterium]|nr:hypothetical protein [Cytophagales bacterium]